MSVRLISAALLGAAASLSACAPASPEIQNDVRNGASATARACVSQRDIRNFRVSNEERNVYVRGPNRTVYRLEVVGVCPDLDRTLGIGFAPRGGVNNLCTGDMTRLVFGGAPSAMPCDVRMAGAMSPAEVAALPDRERP